MFGGLNKKAASRRAKEGGFQNTPEAMRAAAAAGGHNYGEDGVEMSEQKKGGKGGKIPGNKLLPANDQSANVESPWRTPTADTFRSKSKGRDGYQSDEAAKVAKLEGSAGAAWGLYYMFVCEGAPLKVKVDDDVRNGVLDMLRKSLVAESTPPVAVFDAAVRAVEKIMARDFFTVSAAGREKRFRAM
jgi:hypothetical protein